MPSIAVVETPASDGGGPTLRDVPGHDRLRQRRLQAALRTLCCDRGLPALRSGRSEGASYVLTVVADRADRRFVETTQALADQFGLRIEVVAVVPSSRVGVSGPIPDTVDSMGAIALARQFRDVSGLLPEWDVLHGPRALTAYVDRTHPHVVALPHHAHRPHSRCTTLRTARNLTPTVLIA